jgi:hypothetical protein
MITEVVGNSLIKTIKGEMKMSGKWKKLCGIAVFLLIASMPMQKCFAQGPDTVVLDSLAQYYDPVEFDHTMHVDLLGDNSCAFCHHHTVGTPLVDDNCRRCHDNGGETDSANCEDCHPAKRFDAEYLAKIEKDIHLYHLDKPGLKGAFHQRCLGCHKEMDAAIGCQDCHTRTDAGDKMFRSGKYAPAQSEHAPKH